MKKMLAAAAFAAFFAMPAAAQQVGDIKIETPWTRATPTGAKVGGGFMTIFNQGKTTDRLVSGSSDIAGRFEVHEMAVENGIMKMRELASGLELPAGGKVELKPGSYHVMFMELKKPIVEGETVKATLVFEKAGKVDVVFDAKAIGASAGAHKH
jgi:hypothetical protein